MDLGDMVPDGYTIIGFVGSIKALDKDGDVGLVNVLWGVSRWEALGMLITAADDQRHAMQEHEPDT